MDKLEVFGLLFKMLYSIFSPLRITSLSIANKTDIFHTLLTKYKLLLSLFIVSLIPVLGVAQTVTVPGPTDSLTVGLC